MQKFIFSALTLAALFAGAGVVFPQAIPAKLMAAAGAAERPRVVVSTDIGGTDPDDFQSMVHLLLYADALDIEGLVSSPWGPGRAQHIHPVLDVYEREYAALSGRSLGYPSPAVLRALTILRHFAERMERCAAAPPVPEKAPQLAFPSAEGYGRFAQGGRGGRVIHVTNLNDSGPGSLRDAVEQSGPRTVVFDVSGLISLESKLIVRTANSNLTIAGQTAPGMGICLRKYNFGMLGASHVVIRYLRVRPGNISGTTLDGMGLASSDHCIIDHCSISWTLDEAFSSRSARNITLQRTLISEALNAAGHRKYPPGTQHGYAASIGGDTGSFHHNLLANNCGRNWSLAGGLNKADNTYAGRLDIRNNVVFNWKDRTTDGGAHEVNFVGNYYLPGPATKTFVALNAQYSTFPGSQRYYFAGNVMPGHFNLTNQEAGRMASTERGGRLPDSYSPWAEQEFFPSHVKTQSAMEAFSDVLANVGCNFPGPDAHDKRIIAEVRSGKTTFTGSTTGLLGLPDSQDDVGGWENYPEIHRPADWDTDGDGIPGDWEKTHGLNPGDASDGNLDSNGDGYTNLEKYLNSLVGEYEAALQ